MYVFRSDVSSTPRANSTPRSSLSMPQTPRFDFPVTSSFPPWRTSSAADDDTVTSPPTPASAVGPGLHQIFEHLRSGNIESLKAALKADTPGSSTRGMAASMREDTNQYVPRAFSQSTSRVRDFHRIIPMRRLLIVIPCLFVMHMFHFRPRYTPLMVAVYNISGPKSGK